MVKKLLSSLFVLLIVFAVQANPVTAGKVLMKLQSQFPSKLPVGGTSILYFVDQVDKISNGEVRMKFFEPGKLVPPAGVLDAVSKGQVDVGVCSSAYWAGKLPAAPLFLSAPFDLDAPGRLAWLLHGNGLKLWQEMYDSAGYNVKVLPMVVIPNESAGWFAKPISSLDDLKGLKIRYGGFAGDVMKKLGASVSFMPMGDVFPALEKGALDACEFSFPSVDAFLGFSKVVKYNYFPGWHQPSATIEVLINKDLWENKLSPHQQAVIEASALSTITWGMALGEAKQAAVLKDNVENKGVIIKTWSPEMLEAFRKTWEEVAGEQSAKDPFFKKAWEDLSAFSAEYELWLDTGYLPRNCNYAK